MARNLVKEHLALAVAGFALLFIMLRLVVIARGNALTISAILSNSGTANVVVGSLAPALAVALSLAVVIVLIFTVGYLRVTLPAGYRAWRWPIRAACVAVVLIACTPALLAAPYPLGLLTLSLVVTSTLASWSGRRAGKAHVSPPVQSRALPDAPTYGPEWPAALLAVVMVCAVYFVLAFQLPPWMTSEVVKTTGRPDTVGFVLREDTDRLLILRARDRRVLWLTNVESRQVCSVDQVQQPLLHLHAKPDYPRCPHT
jgi:hypothetical protein